MRYRIKVLRWEWDTTKNSVNRRTHGLSFETAKRVFDDPFAATRRDPYPYEERWQTIGKVRTVAVVVIHTHPEYDSQTNDKIGRIISARKATKHERNEYEEGYWIH